MHWCIFSSPGNQERYLRTFPEINPTSFVLTSAPGRLLAGRARRQSRDDAPRVRTLLVAIPVVSAGAAHLPARIVVDVAHRDPLLNSTAGARPAVGDPAITHGLLAACKVASDILLAPTHLESVEDA